MLSRIKATPETIIGRLGYVLLVVVSIVSWSLSARHLHAWGMKDLHEKSGAAWLIPATFDLAPLGLSLVVFQARQKGRGAIMWRLFIVSFTGVSSWINWTWTAQDSAGSRLIAASLPVAAVVLFEALTWQVHRDAMDKVYDGKPIPRVPIFAWFVDFNRAFAVTKANALRPLDAAEETLRQMQAQHAATVVRKPARKASQITDISAEDKPAIEAPKQTAKRASSRERVLDFAIENPNASQTEIASALEVSAATVSRALSRARAAVEMA